MLSRIKHAFHRVYLAIGLLFLTLCYALTDDEDIWKVSNSCAVNYHMIYGPKTWRDYTDMFFAAIIGAFALLTAAEFVVYVLAQYLYMLVFFWIGK